MPIVTAKSRELLPPKLYPASLTEVQERISERNGGEYFQWHFRVQRKDGNTAMLSATSSTTFTQKSKAWAWAEALLGRPIAVGEKFELNDLAGKSCLLDVRVDQREGLEFNSVAAVLPPPDA